jgi:hypothetical protein
MMNLSYKDLGAAGSAWVTYCLTPDRPWAISRWVLEERGLAGGSVLAMGAPGHVNLPADVKLQCGPLTYGIELSQRASAEPLVRLFARIEHRYGPCFLVIEADLLKPGDPYVRELPPGTMMADGRDLYYVEPLADATDAKRSVMLFNSVSTGYPLVAFILSETTPDAISDAFRRHEVDGLGNRVIAIVNSVFDDDGYSIWLPDSVRLALLGQGG